MRPFAPLSYIKSNMVRSAVLAAMLGFTAICFLAGMYIEHQLTVYELSYDKPSDYLMVYAGSNSMEIQYELSDFGEVCEDYAPDKADTVMGICSINISYKTIMGYDNSTNTILFRKVEDFEEFNRVMNDIPDDVVLSDGEIMLSRTLADNWGVKEGDVLEYSEDWDKAYFGSPVTIKAIVDVPGMVLYGVSSEVGGDTILILRSEPDNVPGYDKETINDDLESIVAKINADFPDLKVQTNYSWMSEIRSQLSMFTYILIAISVIIGIVLAVTVNAAFSAAYEKRKYEFSIYKAIGFSGGQIFGKVAGEVLLLDLFGLIAGGITCLMVILITNYILRPEGIYFFKVSVNGILATIGCNLMVVIPTILLNMKRVRRYDVTVY